MVRMDGTGFVGAGAKPDSAGAKPDSEPEQNRIFDFEGG
jgi:hypothetical protein